MARCQCNKTCDCFVWDDGYYDGGLLHISNNDTTYVEGVGTQDFPYIIHNIHDPNFVPPAAKINYSGGSFATDYPGASGGGKVFFDSAIFDTSALYNTNQKDRLTVHHEGLYYIGLEAFFSPSASGAATQGFRARIDHYRNNVLYYAAAVRDDFFETNSVTLVAQCNSSRIIPAYCQVGDYFLMYINWDLKPITAQAAMWVAYV